LCQQIFRLPEKLGRIVLGVAGKVCYGLVEKIGAGFLRGHPAGLEKNAVLNGRCGHDPG
jgi:hypothetical protein